MTPVPPITNASASAVSECGRAVCLNYSYFTFVTELTHFIFIIIIIYKHNMLHNEHRTHIRGYTGCLVFSDSA